MVVQPCLLGKKTMVPLLREVVQELDHFLDTLFGDVPKVYRDFLQSGPIWKRSDLGPLDEKPFLVPSLVAGGGADQWAPLEVLSKLRGYLAENFESLLSRFIDGIDGKEVE